MEPEHESDTKPELTPNPTMRILSSHVYANPNPILRTLSSSPPPLPTTTTLNSIYAATSSVDSSPTPFPATSSSTSPTLLPTSPPFLLSPPMSIQTLRQRSYRYSLSARTQTLTLVASTLGFLIFLAADHAIIASPFFGVDQPSPIFPLRLRQPLLTILTSSPLTDDSCTLVITDASCTLFCARLLRRKWCGRRQFGLNMGLTK